jgi:hypothetical protein
MMRARLALVFAMIALAGCASTPQASRERDAEAKRFLSRPDAALIYVYRDDFPTIGGEESNDSVLYVNDRLIGATLSRTFFKFDVRAGAHVLQGVARDQGTLKLDTRDGELYFVSLQVVGGRSVFRLVDAETGKRDILRCCSLMENWEPGQRPLFR